MVRVPLSVLSVKDTESLRGTGPLSVVTRRLTQCWRPCPHTVRLSNVRTDTSCTSATSKEWEVSLESRKVVLERVGGGSVHGREQ